MLEILHYGHKSPYINSLLTMVEEYVNQNLECSEFENIFEIIWFAKRPNGHRRLTKKEEFLFWVSLLEKKNSEFSNVFRKLILEHKIKPRIYDNFFYIYAPDNSQIPKQAVSLLELAALTDQSTQLLTFLIFRGLKPSQGYPIQETGERMTVSLLSRVTLPNGAQQECIRACKKLFNSLEDYKDNRFDWSNSLASAYSTEVGKEFIHDCLLRMADELVALSKPIDKAGSDTETENSLLISEETLSQEGTILVPLSKSSPLKDLTLFPILVKALKAIIENAPRSRSQEMKKQQLETLFDNITPIVQIHVENLPEMFQSDQNFITELTKCQKWYRKYNPGIHAFHDSQEYFLKKAVKALEAIQETKLLPTTRLKIQLPQSNSTYCHITFFHSSVTNSPCSNRYVSLIEVGEGSEPRDELAYARQLRIEH